MSACSAVAASLGFFESFPGDTTKSQGRGILLGWEVIIWHAYQEVKEGLYKHGSGSLC